MPGPLRRRRFVLIPILALLGGLLPQATLAAAPTMSTVVVKSGLVHPWDVAFLPDGQMLVTERPGRVRVYASGSPNAALVRTIHIGVTSVGESGLMGIAVDVDFATNRFVYVCASQTINGVFQNRVIRYTVRGDGNWAAAKVLVGGMSAANIHDGCAVEMTRDGRLWVSMGDAADGNRAQNRNSLNGKILRMNREGGTPTDNPVIGGVRNIVYSMGHRNVQGLAIRPGTNQVYAIEHGPNVNDEVNRIVAGGNYGWPCHSGHNTGPCGSAATTIAPLWASGGSTIATSGGTFVAGTQWGDYNGHLFVSTLKEQDIRRFSINAAGTSLGNPATHFNGTWGRLRASVLGPGGQLYATTSDGSDQVVRISPAGTSVGRIAGANRYATAAQLSAAAYPSGATDVMIATGADFPDALAGSAAAGMLGMPILLTAATQLPNETKAELSRLKPQRIWVLGGTSVISNGVVSALAPYASGGPPTRVSGADRYATAAAISQRWYPTPGVNAAFVAVGTNFADALAGAPSAALRDSPLLLVRSGGIPASTAAELDRLNPDRIYVLGGTAVIGAAVASALDQYTTGPVTRLAGANRFATAEAITRTFWTKASTAYVASGVNFPDALSGGAVAGKQGLPMLLSGRSDATLFTGQEVLRLSARRLNMLGGPVALTSAVETRLKRLVASP
ncbi:MAG TPA: PQQ-dependent sugar dehydrogenase [Candidatus Limnocylindria bacterium]|nr:PQQ-dependent sugar dehydrogenase [Candidatus Limnocylindria bacterium]